jgi:hypothetical protein
MRGAEEALRDGREKAGLLVEDPVSLVPPQPEAEARGRSCASEAARAARADHEACVSEPPLLSEKPGQGFSLPLTGDDEYEAETFFPMLGMAIRVVNPGEPTGTYHWETEQEDFLVVSGEAVLIVEGHERRL